MRELLQERLDVTNKSRSNIFNWRGQFTPHKEKLEAAIRNPKCGQEDRDLLQQALQYYEEWIANTAGTVYKSKDDAIAAFKQKNAATYTNKFDTEPTSRPSYIPSSTRVGGNTYNVSYNSQYHGYGYYGPSGVWTAYDTFRDTMMLAALMDRDNYVVTSPNPVVVQHSSGMGFFKWILGIVVIGFILIVAIAMFTPNKLRY